jgi:uncharacterized protein involved in exopolysaccharide biosynthesis
MKTETIADDMSQQDDLHPESLTAGNLDKDEGAISVLDLLIVLAERKRLIFSIAGIFAIVAIVISILLPKQYTATVTLMPPQQNTSLASAMSAQLGSLGGLGALAGGSLGLKNPNDTFVAMFRSRTVEDAMVEHFGLMQEYHQRYLSDACKKFESKSTVEGTGKDNLIHISVEDTDPRRAADLANGYVDQFRTLSQHLAITEASQRRLFFEQELEHAKDKLADAEEALKRTEQTTGMIELDSQARALIQSAASLRAQITAREVEIQGMETYATGENAQLIQAQRELDSLRAQLAKLGGSGDGSSDELIVPKGSVPEAGLQYVRKLRDVKYYETIFEIIARQFEVAKLDEAKQGALVQVVDPATPPDRRSFPKRALIVIGATLLGLFIAVLWVLVKHGLARLNEDHATSEKLATLKRAISIRRRKKF